MNKCVLNVVPFILNDNYRNIKPFHHYTVEEVKEIDLWELTELALLIPQFLQPEGWKFKYSWADGNIVTLAANPHTFNCPAPEVVETIIQRIQKEGFAMFHTVRNHYLFLEWDWEYTGCLNKESFLSLIKDNVPCYYAKGDLYHRNGGLYTEEWDEEVQDFGLFPLSVKAVSPENENLLEVLDYLAKKDVLKIVIK